MGVQIAKYFIALTLAAVEREGQALLPCHTVMRVAWIAVEPHAFIVDRAIEPALLLSPVFQSRNRYVCTKDPSVYGVYLSVCRVGHLIIM